MKICPSCGKHESAHLKFVGSFCENCHFEHHKLYDAPHLLEAEQCQKCRKVRISGEWKPFSNNEMKKWIAGKVKTPFSIAQSELKLDEVKIEGGGGLRRFDAVLDAEFDAEGLRVKRSIPIILKIKQAQCPECSLRSGGYFESIIQLRGSAVKIAKYADRLHRMVERKKSYVTKIEELKEGVNLYIARKRTAHEAIHALKLRFSTSRTLAGKKEGKDLYRTTYCIRFDEPLKEGEELETPKQHEEDEREAEAEEIENEGERQEEALEEGGEASGDAEEIESEEDLVEGEEEDSEKREK